MSLKLNFIIAIIAINFMASEQCQQYTVKSGDTCWSIWTNNKISEQNFYSYNPSVNCGALTVGQVVCVSSTIVTTVAPPTVNVNSLPFTSCSQAHVVKSGEFCYKIMEMYGINDPFEFMKLNPTINCNNLPAGSLVCVALVVSTTPAPTTTTAAPVTTVPTTTAAPITTVAPVTVTYPPLCKKSVLIEQGDTCFQIVKYSGITADELKRLNPTLNCDNLQVGSLLCLEAFPIATTTAAPPVVTTIATTIAPIVGSTIAPIVGSTVAPSKCTKVYNVKGGDTCWGIANQVTKLGDAAFYSLNPTIACSSLEVGQEICISYCTAKTYEVKSGDYCWLIMTNNNLTMQKLTEYNPGLDCTALPVGKSITVGPC